MHIRESINILTIQPEVPELVPVEIETTEEVDYLAELRALLDKTRMYSYSIDENGVEFATGVDSGVSMVGDWIENLINVITERTNGPEV